MIAGAWICLLAPLAGALGITLAGQRISRRTAGWISTLSTFVAFGGALAAFFGLWATDPSDRATLEEEYTLELRTRDRERKLWKKVEKSLRMIDDGSYGWCEETGEPIGVPRLLARPTATLSLEAQERRERVQKLYGD